MDQLISGTVTEGFTEGFALFAWMPFDELVEQKTLLDEGSSRGQEGTGCKGAARPIADTPRMKSLCFSEIERISGCVKLDPQRTWAGVPVIPVRDFLRKFQMGRFGPKQIENELGISSGQATKLLEALSEDKMVEKTESGDYWQATGEGIRLANANANKRVARKTAERKLAELLKRVGEVNANPEFAYRVAKVVVFGSYVTGGDTLGDLDLVVTLRPRHLSETAFQDHRKERIKLRIASGFSLSHFEQVWWPRREVMQYLKARSSFYSFHEETDEIAKECEQLIVFGESDPTPETQA